MTELFEPAALNELALQALDDLKAEDILSVDVTRRSSFTDYMIFATGTSTRHVVSIAEAVVDAAEKTGQSILGVEGKDVGDWVLVDLGDAIVHIMLPKIREFYELEKLWGEDTIVEAETAI
jgi:ribosome-associated protein